MKPNRPIPQSWPLADAMTVLDRARAKGFRSPDPAEQDRYRLLFAFIGHTLVKSRRPHERVSWVKTAAESLLGELTGEHIWIPEAEVRLALRGWGFRVVGDRVWCRALPETSEALAALATPALREALDVRAELNRRTNERKPR